MTQIPLDKAYLTAIWLETLLYGERVFRNSQLTPFTWKPGINFTICWICCYVLIKKKNRTPWIIVTVVIFQWMVSTVHVSLGFMVRKPTTHDCATRSDPPRLRSD